MNDDYICLDKAILEYHPILLGGVFASSIVAMRSMFILGSAMALA
jgi:hypothetical protein